MRYVRISRKKTKINRSSVMDLLFKTREQHLTAALSKPEWIRIILTVFLTSTVAVYASNKFVFNSSGSLSTFLSGKPSTDGASQERNEAITEATADARYVEWSDSLEGDLGGTVQNPLVSWENGFDAFDARYVRLDKPNSLPMDLLQDGSIGDEQIADTYTLAAIQNRTGTDVFALTDEDKSLRFAADGLLLVSFNPETHTVTYSVSSLGSASSTNADLLNGHDSTYYLDLCNAIGTLDASRFSAYYDLFLEGYLGNDIGDIMRLGSVNISELSDVDTSTNQPVANQVLGWDGTNWVPINNPDTDTTYTATNGLNLNGTAFGLGGSLTASRTRRR